MDKISKIIGPRKRNPHLHSEMHELADRISSTFWERKKFAMYLGVIKHIGVTEAQKIFSEIKQSEARNPGKLFVWKSKQKAE